MLYILLAFLKSRLLFSVIFIFFFSNCFALDCLEDLFDERNEECALFYDLAIAQYWDEKLNERLPVCYNHLLQTGYFVTPSARMKDGGEIGTGFAYAPPYSIFSLRAQLFSHLEISANYRIFQGVDDPGLSKFGYGDFTDRGANVKLALATPEDTGNVFPGIAIGAEDFFGTERFKTYYFLATKNWMPFGLETTIGWGTGRFSNSHSKGFFGGFAWYPFYRCENIWTRGLGFAAEYDPIDYEDPEIEPHPYGRVKNFFINYGVKYNFCEYLDLSVSHIRGDALAIAGALNYNWGTSEGFLPKVDDSIPYYGPCNHVAIGDCRTISDLVICLKENFDAQGFQLNYIWLENCIDPDGYEIKKLTIQLMNLCYREELVMRYRLSCLLAALLPENIDQVSIIIESFALACQQYYYSRELLTCFANKQVGDYEMEILTPMHEVTFPDLNNAESILYSPPSLYHFELQPHFETFLNNAKGKFKYDIGLKASVEGILPKDIYYEAGCTYTALSSLGDICDFDFYNPSQLPNVQTDYVRYRQQSSFTIDQLYVQRCWNLSHGWFGRFSGGYFEPLFGGAAAEIMFYPVNWNFAIGLEGAVLKKRRYSGLGFFNTLRHLEGYTPVYSHYTVLDQYFLDVYFDLQSLTTVLKISVGQFLARDRGVRIEATRYFESGLRLTGWYTITDASDMVNNKVYHDKGISLQLPLDFFFKCRSRRMWNYGLAAWLRDSGAMSETGRPLYEFISFERR